MEIGKLKNRWMNFFQSADQGIIEKAFLKLIEKYSEKHRYYHTLDHISACLKELDTIAPFISDRFCLETALWFHDVIYNPARSDNEVLSAEYAATFLSKIRISHDEIQKVAHLVKITKHPSNPVTEDEKYLIDIDLTILGSENDFYDTYEKQIRNEYSFVPYKLYREGRGKILKTFLKTNRIYQSDYFFENYEIKARNNIERTLRKL